MIVNNVKNLAPGAVDCQGQYLSRKLSSHDDMCLLLHGCKGSRFSNEHTVKRGKYDVYNLHATYYLKHELSTNCECFE